MRRKRMPCDVCGRLVAKGQGARHRKTARCLEAKRLKEENARLREILAKGEGA